MTAGPAEPAASTQPGGPARPAEPARPAGSAALLRCNWATSAPEYVRYHDEEWGTELHGDDALYERLTLEAFQSGLSWITILRKRENFRAAFAGFRIVEVAAFTAADAEWLLADAGIVRNRAKINAAVNNARAALELQHGLDELLWSFAPPAAARSAGAAALQSKTADSIAMSKELKRRGFVFVGPTTAYALMQATGMVVDHQPHCFRYQPYLTQ